jgi:tRNA-dihydrouridine synthase
MNFIVLNSANRLGKIVSGMNWALGEIPVTVKLRTGVLDGRNVAHKIMPRLSVEWNAGCISVSDCLLPHCRRFSQRNPVTWSYTTAAVFKACGLGLHQAMCGCCPCPRSRRGLQVLTSS